MELVEIIKDAFKYPLLNFKKMLVLGIPSLIVGILTFIIIFQNMDMLSVVNQTAVTTVTPEMIASMGVSFIALCIVYLIYTIIMNGIGIAIIRDTINYSDTLPNIKIVKNITDGIKNLIIGMVYFGIPAVIYAMLVAIVMSTLNDEGTTLVYVFLLLTGIFTIAMIILALVNIVAVGHFAETDTLRESLSITNMYKLARKIGLSKILIVMIVCNILLQIIVSIIGTIVIIIPIIGFFIFYYIIITYELLVRYRTYGLLYREKNNSENSNLNNQNNFDYPLSNENNPELESNTVKKIETENTSENITQVANNISDAHRTSENTQMEKCTKCGYTNPDFVNICINCGNDLK